MRSSIFSTYSTGENRVTASILAVLTRLSLRRIERLLSALMEQSEFQLVRFENQPAKGGKGVPDAMIASSCLLLIETKLRRNAIDPDQLRRHLRRLDRSTETTQALIILTPEESRPKVMDRVKDKRKRLVWASFGSLNQAIDGLMDGRDEALSEHETFLLRELQAMLVAERLVGSANDDVVVVVPARDAWPEYEKFHAYVCQPERPFQLVKRIAFYSSGQIHPRVPVILKTHEAITFETGKHEGRLGEVVEGLLDSQWREEGVRYKVMLLSAPDDPATVKLEAPIMNDLTSASGQTVAFTQNQRYVSLQRLKKATRTSDLADR